MRKLKQIMMLLASVTMLLAVCAGTVSAAYSVSGTTTSQEGYTIDYICKNNEEGNRILTITGKGAMVDYWTESCNGHPVSPWAFEPEQWVYYSYGVNIGEGITHIGTNAFWHFYNLYEVTLPETLKSIGASAFYWSTCMTSINIPDSVTYIGECALNSTDLTITCSSTSYAYKYAMEHGFEVKLTDGCAHSNCQWQTTAATCVANGKKVKVCTECGETLAVETIAATGHAAGNSATCTEPSRCKNCSVVLEPALRHKYPAYNCLKAQSCAGTCP